MGSNRRIGDYEKEMENKDGISKGRMSVISDPSWKEYWNFCIWLLI